MKFGRVDNPESIDFSFDHEIFNNLQLSPNTGELIINVGCTGWSTKEWKGTLYPSQSKASDFLNIYSQKYKTVELNSSFYTIPKIETIIKWREETADDFQFCPKVFRGISQAKDLGLSKGLIFSYIDAIAEFGDKLGTCFIQMPEYFDTSRVAVLDLFFEQWSAEIPVSIEFRHPSWFENEEKKKWLLEKSKQWSASVVVTDVAGFRIGVHNILSQDQLVIRWVGNNLIKSDFTRMESWLIQLQKMKKLGLKEVFFLVHEPNNILAPDMCDFLIECCQKISNFSIANHKIPSIDQLKLF